MNRETIKLLSRETGVSFKKLIALASANDPFYVGGEAGMEQAEWFQALWQRFGYERGVHLRRVHYQIVSQEEPVKLPKTITFGDSKTDVYINNERCFKYLVKAGAHARYLGIVALDAFVDRRNPQAILNIAELDEPGEVTEFSYDIVQYGNSRLELPRIPRCSSLEPDREDINTSIYHLEVWAEKTTMNDILLPLCRRHDANLITGLGDLSITAAWNLYKRIENSGRPARIFYISDFDGKGVDMPVGISRKLEWLIQEFGSQNAKLQKVILTKQQVEEYKLPRMPIKSTDNTKTRFKSVHGNATELDALEALHPGEFEQILDDTLSPYSGASVRDFLRSKYAEFRKDVAHAESVALGALTDEYAALMPRYNEIIARVKPEFDALREDLERIENDVFNALVDAEDIHPEDYLEGLEQAMSDEQIEEEIMLFESQRSYMGQMEFYNMYKAGEEI